LAGWCVQPSEAASQSDGRNECDVPEIPRIKAKRGMKMRIPILCLSVALSCLVISARHSAQAKSPGKPEGPPTEASSRLFNVETIQIITDKTAVRWNDELVTTLAEGRRLGVIRNAAELVEIQVCVSGHIRRGWIKHSDLRLLKGEDVDIAAEWLQISKTLNPKLDSRACSLSLQALVERLASSATLGRTAQERCRLIGAELFEKEGFHFVTGEQFFSADSFLDGRKGNCLSLSLIYLCVAQKMRLPLYLVQAPNHAFVRYESSSDFFNIETTEMGKLYPTDEYLREFLEEGKFRQIGGAHLKSLPYPRVIGILTHQLGCSLRDQGKGELAIQKFQSAIEINPEFPESYYSWGKILASMKKDAEACDQYRLTTERNPNDATAYFEWGVSLSFLGKYQEACDKLGRSLEINPKDVRIYFNLAQAFSGMGKYAEACQISEKALTMDPRFWPGLFNYGLQLSKMGKNSEARIRLKEALDLAPEGMKPMIRQRIAELPMD
jgi:tetratricopeptide (TPR) repeat protein